MRTRLSGRRKKTWNNLQNTTENSVSEEMQYLSSGTVRFLIADSSVLRISCLKCSSNALK